MGQVGLDDMALFVRVALAGGVRAAARDGGDSRSLLSRRLAGLEARLGVRLIARDTLHFELTDAGRVFLEHAEQVVAAARAAEDAARAAAGKVRGRVRIACSPVLAEVAVEELVCDYLARYPEAAVDLHVAAERIDLRAHRIDLAFRTAPLRADASMRQRRLAESRVALLASPEYLAARGTPRTIADLAAHDAILVGNASSFPLGDEKLVLRDRLRVNGYSAARRAAVAGLGIAWFSTVYARAELVRGDLKVVLPETATLSTVYAVMPGTGALAAKVRAFLELAVQRVTSERLLGDA